ncbi:MAG: response regulator transcription factor [Melioribacteraceae bacterium]|nr:response regulator transcription factor [Melioribacteraceae bacterium]
MKKVLLIEDNILLAENIQSLLEEENFAVLYAACSGEAIELLKKNEFEIILCDIMLPDQDGFELIRNLQMNYGSKMPPFIFLTAKTQRAYQRKGMELGADDYLTKPFTRDELINSINTQLTKRASIIGSSLKSQSEPEEHNTSTPGKKELTYDGYIFINEKNSPAFLPLKNIILIRSMKDYTQIHLKSRNKLLVRRTLENWESILPSNYFVRIHRQSIINLEYVEKIEHDTSYTYRVTMKDTGIIIKISQRYARKIKKTIGNYMK